MTGFMERQVKASDTPSAPKILVFAASECGKTHDALANLPRPMLLIDADVSVKAMLEGERFDQNILTRNAPFSTMGEVIEYLREFTQDAVALKTIKSVVIDSLTVVWDRETRALGVDGQGTKGTAEGHSKLAAMAKELKALLRLISAYGIAVYATAELRKKTAVPGGRYDPNNTRDAAGLSESKFNFAFDLIYQKVSRDEVHIGKSRYGSLKKGDTLKDFSFARVMMPIIEGKVTRIAGLVDFEPASQAHEDLHDLLMQIGTKARGGKLEREDAVKYIALAKSGEERIAEVKATITLLTKQYLADQSAIAPGTPAIAEAPTAASDVASAVEVAELVAV